MLEYLAHTPRGSECVEIGPLGLYARPPEYFVAGAVRSVAAQCGRCLAVGVEVLEVIDGISED